MALTQQQLEKLKELNQRRMTQVTPSVSETVPQSTSSGKEIETSKGGLGEKVKNLVGGAIYGVSAPGRFIQNQIFNRIGSAIAGEDIGGKATKEGFEKSSIGPSVDLDTTSGKIGQFVGETVPMAVTGGVTGAAVKGLPLAARAAAMGAASFGQQSINEQEINRSSVVAGLTDAALPFAGRALKLGGDILKGLAGGVSGTGVDVIEAALARPGAAFKAAGKGSVADLKVLSESIRSGASKLYKKAGAEYAETVAKAGITELPKDEVVSGVGKKLVDLADAQLTDDGLKLVDTPFTDIEEKQLQKVYNTVSNWTDYTPQGVNTLATRISKFRRGAQDSTNFDRVVDGVRSFVREYVGTKEPAIAEAVTKYATRMDLLDEIDNVLKTSPELGTREGVRKTSEALGRIFNANKEFSREAVESLEKELGIDIIGTMAGQQLSQTAPRSTSRIGDLMMSLVQPAGSVVTRNVAPLVGAMKLQVVDKILAVPGVPPASRAAIVQAVSELFSEPDEGFPEATNEESPE